MLFVQVGEGKVPAEFLLESHPHRYWLPAKKVKTCDKGCSKNYSQKYIKVYKFLFLKSLLRAKGFSCSLDVLYGGLGIRKLQFLI
jgi:hypothetical protein